MENPVCMCCCAAFTHACLHVPNKAALGQVKATQLHLLTHTHTHTHSPPVGRHALQEDGGMMRGRGVEERRLFLLSALSGCESPSKGVSKVPTFFTNIQNLHTLSDVQSQRNLWKEKVPQQNNLKCPFH